MSEYGCCTLSKCIYHIDDPKSCPNTCEECYHYDPNFFKEKEVDSDGADK